MKYIVNLINMQTDEPLRVYCQTQEDVQMILAALGEEHFLDGVEPMPDLVSIEEFMGEQEQFKPGLN